MKRRDFLGKLAVSSITSAGLMAFLGSMNLSIPKVFSSANKFKIGHIKDFPVNAFTFIPDKNIFVLRDRKGVRALSAICTHLECVVNQKDNGFQCPCHGSLFDEKGEVLSGPAPKRLNWLKVGKAPDGQLIVNLNKKVKFDDQFPI